MVNAPLDENGRPGMIGVLNTDGKTITPVKATATGLLHVDDGITGTYLGGHNAKIDENTHSSMYALSSVDGVTRVLLQVDSTGALLIDSN